MKEVLFEFFDNWWAVFWFVIGLTYIVLGTISAVNNENEKALACLGIALACHARSEVAILKRKIDKKIT